jgi:hypothetical protein
MLRTVLLTGVSAAAVLGVGTAALATSGTAGTPTPASSSAAPSGRHPAARALLRHAAHAEVVLHTSDGYVRHEMVAGTVTAVSAHAISIRAGDGYARTFAVTGQTVVRSRAGRTAHASSIGAVHVGDTALVTGREANSSSAPVPARVVVDGVRR